MLLNLKTILVEWLCKSVVQTPALISKDGDSAASLHKSLEGFDDHQWLPSSDYQKSLWLSFSTSK